jgi:site-specific DNA-methyltransferase (adenine-specific)/modification methylase
MTLINGDCTLVADQITDNSVDFLLTDPPYNISDDGAKPEWRDPETGENKNTIHSQRFDENFESNWDSVTHEEFIQQMQSWSEMWFKKLRKGAAFAVFISDQYISYLWKIMEQTGFEPKRIFTWKKPAAVPFNRRVNPVSGCEYVLWGIKPGGTRTFNASAVQGTMVERYARADKISSIVYRMIKDNTDKSIDTVFADALKESKKMLERQKRLGDVIECVIPNTITYSGGLGKDKIHPTQKPVEVLRYFVELCTDPGDTVMDTFAGSGSTGMACKDAGRNYILIERDPKMFGLMKKKFDADLFE